MAGVIGLFAIGWLVRALDRSSGFAPSVGAVLVAVLPPVAMAGLGLLMVRGTVLETITLDSEGIRLRKRGRETVTPWSAVERITLKRIRTGASSVAGPSLARGPALTGGPTSRIVVVVECPNRKDQTFGPGFQPSPQELFDTLGEFVRARSIAVPLVGKRG